MRTRACQTLVVAACLLCGGVAHAQVARSQFNGTVTDSAGGVLVGATVVATNVETNVESKATTTDAGVYVIPYLANGVYRIPVTAPGFRPAEASEVTLRAAQTLTLDFKLDVDADHRSADRHGAGDRDQHRRDRALRLEQGIPDVADRGGRRAAADSAVHLFEPARYRPAARSRGRSTAAATTRTRSSSKAFRSAATCRAAATTRCRRRPRRSRSSSSRPARSAPSTAAARRRSPTSSSSPGRTSSTDRARSYLHGWRWDARPFVAKALNQTAPVRTSRMGGGGRRPDHAAETVQRHATAASSSPRSRRRARGRADVHRIPHAAHPRVPERRLLAPVRSRHTPVMRDRARSSAPTRSAGLCVSARSTTRARRASWAASVVRDPFPNNQIPRAMWDDGGAEHDRPGPVGCAGARSPVQQPADARRPAARCSTRTRSRRNTTRCSTTNTRCRSTSTASGGSGTTPAPAATAPPPGQADQPLSAAEHAELDDQGFRELGDQRSAAAPLRLRLQPVRQRESQRVFQ